MDKLKVLRRWRAGKHKPLKGKRKPYKGKLIDWATYVLPDHRDKDAQDAQCAALLRISRGHAVLLRRLNDLADPSDVLANPEAVLGPHAALVLAFYRHLDSMSRNERKAAAAHAWTDAAYAAAARDEAFADYLGSDYIGSDGSIPYAELWGAAAAVAPGWDSADTSAAAAADAAADAVWEILAHEKLRAAGQPLFFLGCFFPNQDPIAALGAISSA